MNSIKFCNSELIDRLRQEPLLRDYFILEEKSQFKDRYTNIGALRAYLEAYIQTIPTFNGELTHMVRQLDPTEKGLPLEIYFFTSEKRWEEYEAIQSDLFDHVLAIVPFFELNVFQNPSGTDLKALKN